MKTINPNEQIWDDLLSRNPALIQKTYRNLTESDMKTVINHLIKITTEVGWHLEQKRSAQTAINVIRKLE